MILIVTGKFGICKYGNFGNMGIWDSWNKGIMEICKGPKHLTRSQVYSSIPYVDHSYFCPYCFDFIYQGLRKAELILEEDTLGPGEDASLL